MPPAKLTVGDGRETAPAGATPNLFLGADGQPLGFREALVGGRPVGVPGIVRLLEAIYKDHGKLPWARLFQPAIRLAEDGFPVTDRLHWWLDSAKDFLSSSTALRARFYNPDGSPLQVGQLYRNPDLAATLHAIADHGAAAFYAGPLAEQMVDAVRQGAGDGAPGLATEELQPSSTGSEKLPHREARRGLRRLSPI